jgi:hypothetical protein
MLHLVESGVNFEFCTYDAVAPSIGGYLRKRAVRPATQDHKSLKKPKIKIVKKTRFFFSILVSGLAGKI